MQEMIWMVGLKNIRKQRNLNQQKVAMDLNISREALSYYENGKRDIPTEVLNKLADFYGVSTDYLLGRTAVKEPYPKN